MCGIAGFSNPLEKYMAKEEKWRSILEQMNQVQKRRGPDDEGIYLQEKCGLSHVRLSVIDLFTGHQPMIRKSDGHTCAIVYNGEIYNMKELKSELQSIGAKFETSSDTEVILAGFMRFGAEYVKKLNGIFALAIWDTGCETLYLFRDRLGVKPLFYTKIGDTLVFSSEIKGLFQYPGFKPVLNHDGLCEVFGLGPAKSYGKGVFKDVKEVLPGCYLEYGRGGQREHNYWKLESREHTDSYEKTVENTASLIYDAVTKQMLSDVPISTFLSGGVDSSLVTAICAKELQKKGKAIDTFSFDFKDNQKYFKANTFQPGEDRPWVEKMVDFSETNHTFLECDNMDLITYLYKAVDARDLPCMADVESSLLYFCSKVVKTNKVTLTGECADEIFGGYPWFHQEEAFTTPAFPWSKSMEPRKSLLKEEIFSELNLEAYTTEVYEKSIAETPCLQGESKIEKRRREIAYLNLRWFMATLLDRMDRTSMYSGLEARVPFADYRIVEYIWNVPWDMKCPNGVVKGLLRAAGEEYLPKEVLYRRKSPYPKTYNPAYEELLGKELIQVMKEPNAPIRQLIDGEKLLRFIKSPSDYGKPWYGQLMAGPQMLAYILQVNYWLSAYKIQID